MIKQQINKEIMIAHLNTIFFSDKSKILSNFKNKIFQITNDGFLQIMFRHRIRDIKKVKNIVIKKNISRCFFSCFKCQ